MFDVNNRVIILSPHTDDGEFGCGGTISRMCEKGVNVRYVAFSAAEASVPEGFPSDILRREVIEATDILGIKKDNVDVLSYPVRRFHEFRQDILDDMIKLAREYDPDAVFLPSPNDTHQDHNVIAHEGFRAFKRKTMMGYEIPWNNLSFNTNAFVFLEEKDIARKIHALGCYKSQSSRSYASKEFIRSLARTRGVQIGCQYAEVFEVIRWIIK